MEIAIDGDLDLTLPGCVGDPTACHKFEDDDLAGLPMLSSGEASFEVVEWITKGGRPDELVGFHFELEGGSVELTIKSGNPQRPNGSLHTVEFNEPGTHTWINPWCEEVEGESWGTCRPKNTAAISYIDTCLTPATGAGCASEATAELSVRVPMLMSMRDKLTPALMEDT